MEGKEMIEILPGVELDDRQRKVIFLVQEHTLAENVTLTVTRGHSTPLQQLKIIERKAGANDCMFSEFVPGNLHDKTGVWRNGQEVQVYLWQQTWSMLLLRGEVVNPPLAAVCLEHYIRPGDEDMHGKLMYPSPHIKDLYDPAPCPLDFSGLIDRGMGTQYKDLARVARILEKAKAADCGIRFIKIEPKNNCAHCDLEV
jgi:hypothetical protein